MAEGRSILSRAVPYELFQRLVGAKRVRRVFVREYVRPKPGDRVLDIGCGPGTLLRSLPPVDYLGVDPSADYIKAAREHYGSRGEFRQAGIQDPWLDEQPDFDLIVAAGVLHHLEDEVARRLFSFARDHLRPGGRLATFDGCFVDGQRRLARWLLANDRGRHVRTPDDYRRLAESAFSRPSLSIRSDLLRVPYTHCILECQRA